ncbi:MAG: hypothetical protein ACRCT0_00575, partial [Plesiomonas shigelloides]
VVAKVGNHSLYGFGLIGAESKSHGVGSQISSITQAGSIPAVSAIRYGMAWFFIQWRSVVTSSGQS